MKKLVEWLHRLHFQSLIALFASGIIIGTLLLQIYYVKVVHNTIEENDVSVARDAGNQVADTVRDLSAQLDRIGQELAFNRMALDVSNSANAWEWLVQSKYMNTTIHATRISNDNVENIFYTDLNMLVLGNGSEDEFAAITQLHQMETDGVLGLEHAQHIKVGEERYYLCKSVMNKQENRQFYVLIRYTTDAIDKKMAAIQQENAFEFVLVDEDGKWICGYGPQAQMIYERYRSGISLEKICVKGVISEQTIAETGWKLITAMMDRKSAADYASLKSFAIITSFGLMVLTALVSYAMKQSIAKPVHSMIAYMRGVVENRSYRPFQIVWHNELGELADTMNVMLRHLEESNRKTAETKQMLYMAELDKKQLKINALYSQINPHFLYNTLDCIRSIALVNDQHEIADMTESMAYIFRYSIKGAAKVRVREEVHCICEYLRIIQIRHMYSYKIDVNVSPDTEELIIPKLILQPVVENAVFHGLEQVRSGGCLSIRGWLEGDQLILEVTDNGKGMPPEQMEELQRRLQDEPLTVSTLFDNRRSIGLVNINARIRMAYGKDFGVKLMKNEEKGTCVRLYLRKEAPAEPVEDRFAN